MIKSSLAAAVLSLCLSSCSVKKEIEEVSEPINTRFTRVYFKDVDLHFVTDTQTGEEYLHSPRGALIKLNKPQSTNP